MSSILIQIVVVIAGLAIVAVGFGSAGRLKSGMVLIGIGLVAPVVLTIVRSFAPLKGPATAIGNRMCRSYWAVKMVPDTTKVERVI